MNICQSKPSSALIAFAIIAKPPSNPPTAPKLVFQRGKKSIKFSFRLSFTRRLMRMLLPHVQVQATATNADQEQHGEHDAG